MSTTRFAEGGLIDRSKPLRFSFDGRGYKGFAGDTLASALLASGVRLFGRSFKYHRPRGVLTAGSEEPNALVELRTGACLEPNTRATTVELFEGLQARSQNRWPSLAFDVGAINQLFGPLFVSGFYYKTFMWPAAFWEKVYEPLIRRAAGLGRASGVPDPDSYERQHAFCDVLVIGGGPAGLSAALAAAHTGARVILCDEDFILGGRLNSEQYEIDEAHGAEWARRVEAELASFPNVRLLPRTTVFGLYDGGTFAALERVSDHMPSPRTGQPRQRMWKIVAGRSVLATGAVERPLVFGGNDRPGVMLTSALRTWVNRFAVAPGTRVAVFANNDDAWRSAFDAARQGIAVRAIIDVRAQIRSQLLARAGETGAEVLLGAQVIEARGALGLRSLSVRDARGRVVRVAADALAMSGGWNPNLSLSTHLGGKPRWEQSLATFVPGNLPPGMHAVGAANGSLTLHAALQEGMAAGIEATHSLGFTARSSPLTATNPALVCTDEESSSLTPFWYVAGSTGKSFVDFQNDVTVDDVALAAREGFKAVEHLKRYTTLGMGTDQGRTSNVNGLAILAALTERAIPQVGTTTFRPPVVSVAIGAIAGDERGLHFKPTRRTAAHGWAEEQGATFIEAGLWLRPQWFAKPGEADWLATVCREVKAVRSSVGVCDVSTLGKIDIQGPDAGAFLDRVYINMFSTLSPGKVRYGLMLREDGIAMDDGTTAHLMPGRYVMSTTTANAALVMQHLEHARQVLWPELDVQIVSVTEQWSQYAIAGPRSRELLQQMLGDAIDLSNDAFPHLACRETVWRGMPACVFRVSFSGELAYELAVPARHGEAAIRAIMVAGAKWDVTPYGTEALSVMRIEKGHVSGNELNGMTTAADLGLDRMMSTKKDFIGRVLAQRPGLVAPDRARLIGLNPVNPKGRLNAGAHLVPRGCAATEANDQGYVTSVAYSPMAQQWIALALLERGPERIGERLRLVDPLRNTETDVEVCSPGFFDPAGERLRV